MARGKKMTAAAFAIALLAGLLQARIAAVSSRGRHAVRPTMIGVLLGVVSILATLATLIWGFTHLVWYWPLAAVVVGIVLPALLVNRTTLGPLALGSSALACLSIVGATYLWSFVR